jgi:hypothetical protein
MSEDALWKRTREHLGPLGRLVRIESSTELGIPDICYLIRRYPAHKAIAPVCGWLELKHVPEWPKRPTTTFRIDKLTLDQVNWATHWALAGGRVSCLLQVATDLIVMDFRLLAQVFGGQHTRGSLLAASPLVSPRIFPTAELVKWLTRT